nr:hypothetical protein [Methanobrevibacter arboriphilus]
MSSASERRNNRWKLVRAIAHTRILSIGSVTSKDLELFINDNNLMVGVVSKKYISYVLSRTTTKRDRKVFKNVDGVWEINKEED